MPSPRYDMLAIDLDGTLLDSAGRVSERNVRAVARARDAGIKVTVCTGRGLVECRHVLREIGQEETAVVAGGSIVACPTTGRTLHRFAFDPGFVSRAVDRMLAHEYPVMVLKDPAEAGYDYLMVQGRARHALDPVTRWWLDHMRVPVRYAESLEGDAHPDHTVRLGVCGHDDRMASICADLGPCFNGHATMHHFPCVVGPDHAAAIPPGRSLHILEVFRADAGKWSAIQWIAARGGIDPSRIAAIGDQVNDHSMIQNAGLGIAMGNAVPSIKKLAARETARNDEDGVAVAIDRILDGAW
jgi:hydroxymethylpyrimidine pyrophosphatase-like HAD family hydrolase